MQTRENLAAGLVVGALSGLVGSWLMLRFIKGPGDALLNSLKSDEDHQHDAAEAQQRQQSGQPAPEHVTMQAAGLFARLAPGGRELSRQEREFGGTVVHYTFGTLMGLGYGIAAEFTTLPTLGQGALFGTVLWTATDLWSVPAVGFAKWPNQEPAAAHLSHWLAHVVYGVGMETTRRLLRR